MSKKLFSQEIINSRSALREAAKDIKKEGIEAEEGGCGVTGFACNIPVSGKHIFEPSVQMHNRGNGKGGGLAAVGLVPASWVLTRRPSMKTFFFRLPSSMNPSFPRWRPGSSDPTSTLTMKLSLRLSMIIGTLAAWK